MTISDKRIRELWESGAKIKDIASELDCRPNTIIDHLKTIYGTGYNKRVKLSRVSASGSRLISIPTNLIEHAGFDVDKEIYCDRTALGDGRILLELTYKKRRTS